MVPSTCRYMRGTACKVGSDLQKKSLFYGYTDYQKGGKKGVLPAFQQDLAAFMLIRGPYAWLGYSWMGCTWVPSLIFGVWMGAGEGVPRNAS